MINFFYICKGYGNGVQFYTTEWERSELSLNPIKPVIVDFIEDPHNSGNWFQYDRERPKILPKWFAEETKPLQMRGYFFIDLEQRALRFRRSK